MTDEEPDARVINAQPWEPLAGMVKQRCPGCRYFFATPVTSDAIALCPDCAALGTKATIRDAPAAV